MLNLWTRFSTTTTTTKHKTKTKNNNKIEMGIILMVRNSVSWVFCYCCVIPLLFFFVLGTWGSQSGLLPLSWRFTWRPNGFPSSMPWCPAPIPQRLTSLTEAKKNQQLNNEWARKATLLRWSPLAACSDFHLAHLTRLSTWPLSPRFPITLPLGDFEDIFLWLCLKIKQIQQ